METKRLAQGKADDVLFDRPGEEEEGKRTKS
jgi:hypothetical protein